MENEIVHWLEVQGLYVEQTEEVIDYDIPEIIVEELVAEGISLKVITKRDPLSVRDIPSMVNCKVFESVAKENTVLWRGNIAFGNGENGEIEPWVKVETLNGNIGWARLIYLCPENEEDFELNLRID